MFLLQYSYVLIAYLSKLQGITGFPLPNYEIFEVSPTSGETEGTQRVPDRHKGFKQAKTTDSTVRFYYFYYYFIIIFIWKSSFSSLFLFLHSKVSSIIREENDGTSSMPSQDISPENSSLQEVGAADASAEEENNNLDEALRLQTLYKQASKFREGYVQFLLLLSLLPFSLFWAYIRVQKLLFCFRLLF